MTSERPSKALLALLAASLLLAGWVYGRPLLIGPDGDDGTLVEPGAIGFVDEQTSEDPAIEPWASPESPRNPFLPVDTGAPAASTGDESGADGPGQDDG